MRKWKPKTFEAWVTRDRRNDFGSSIAVWLTLPDQDRSGYWVAHDELELHEVEIRRHFPIPRSGKTRKVRITVEEIE